jgi:hypothetical protein
LLNYNSIQSITNIYYAKQPWYEYNPSMSNLRNVSSCMERISNSIHGWLSAHWWCSACTTYLNRFWLNFQHSLSFKYVDCLIYWQWSKLEVQKECCCNLSPLNELHQDCHNDQIQIIVCTQLCKVTCSSYDYQSNQ